MILQGNKKRALVDIVRYFMRTTGKSYDDFLVSVQTSKGRVRNDMGYSDWLAAKSFELLHEVGVTLVDCIQNKDVVRAAVMEKESRLEGEFYTPEIWCVEGRKYLKNMLGESWGKVAVWDASCGTGNLMKTENYPGDKLFLSTLLPEDVNIVKRGYPEATVFQCDFLNGIDYDSRNKFFSSNLPANLVSVLENNEPLVIYMNPPYKVIDSKSSDVGSYMASLGMASDGKDLFHQFLYRICMLKRFYNHTNMYLGLFGPITIFQSKMIERLYGEFKKDFVFVDGMCFSAGDFASTSESIGWIVGFTSWRANTDEEEGKDVLLTVKSISSDGVIEVVGKRVITNVEENLHNWSMSNDIVRYEYMPAMTSIYGFKGSYEKFAENALGSMMSSNYLIRATRRRYITTLPSIDGVDITEDNFWRCVASFAARGAYITNMSPYNNCQYVSKPNTSLEGYDDWLANALVIFMFDFMSGQAAYRDVEFDGKLWNVSNKLFPISKEYVASIVTDEVILKDLEEFTEKNNFMLSQLAGVYEKLGIEAKELLEFCTQILIDSLSGNFRKELGYKNSLRAWDAGFRQIPLSKETEEKYTYLLRRLKSKLLEGVYTYGFIVNSLDNTEEVF